MSLITAWKQMATTHSCMSHAEITRGISGSDLWCYHISEQDCICLHAAFS